MHTERSVAFGKRGLRSSEDGTQLNLTVLATGFAGEARKMAKMDTPATLSIYFGHTCKNSANGSKPVFHQRLMTCPLKCLIILPVIVESAEERP